MQVHSRTVLALELDVSPYGVGEMCYLKAHYLGGRVGSSYFFAQFYNE